MRLSQEEQEKLEMNAKIVALLMVLTQRHGLKFVKIAKTLGISQSHISNVNAGKEPGSPLMLSGLTFLLEKTQAEAIENARQQKAQDQLALDAKFKEQREKNLKLLALKLGKK